MDWREEGRIGCSMLMIGIGFAMITSMMALGVTGELRVLQVALFGVLTLAMVGLACMVLTEGRGLHSLVAAFGGAVTALIGWDAVGHPYLYVFPGAYALAGLVSFAFRKGNGLMACWDQGVERKRGPR